MKGKIEAPRDDKDLFRPQCSNHSSIPASYICQECGNSICSYCQRNTDGMPLCPKCFRKFIDRKINRNKKLFWGGIGGGGGFIVLTIITIILLIVLIPTPKEDGYFRVGYSDMLPAIDNDAEVPEDALPIMFTLYISNPGDKEVAGGYAEVVLMKGGIQWDSQSSTIPSISSKGMSKVIVRGFQVKEGQWSGRVSLWRGDKRDQVISISFRITGEDITDFHPFDNMTGDISHPISPGTDDKDSSSIIGIFILLVGAVIAVIVILIATGALSGYAKISSEQLLSHPTRNQVMNYLKDHPGAHFKSISRGVATPPGTLRHHLNYLEREGLVRVLHEGMYKRYFPTGAHLDPDKMEKGNRETIMQVLDKYPGISQVDLRSIVAIPKQTLSYHIRKLHEEGRLDKKTKGSKILLFLQSQPEAT
jgi:predicted transcriptional regulator